MASQTRSCLWGTIPQWAWFALFSAIIVLLRVAEAACPPVGPWTLPDTTLASLRGCDTTTDIEIFSWPATFGAVRLMDYNVRKIRIGDGATDIKNFVLILMDSNVTSIEFRRPAAVGSFVEVSSVRITTTNVWFSAPNANARTLGCISFTASRVTDVNITLTDTTVFQLPGHQFPSALLNVDAGTTESMRVEADGMVVEGNATSDSGQITGFHLVAFRADKGSPLGIQPSAKDVSLIFDDTWGSIEADNGALFSFHGAAFSHLNLSMVKGNWTMVYSGASPATAVLFDMLEATCDHCRVHFNSGRLESGIHAGSLNGIEFHSADISNTEILVENRFTIYMPWRHENRNHDTKGGRFFTFTNGYDRSRSDVANIRNVRFAYVNSHVDLNIRQHLHFINLRSINILNFTVDVVQTTLLLRSIEGNALISNIYNSTHEDWSFLCDSTRLYTLRTGGDYTASLGGLRIRNSTGRGFTYIVNGSSSLECTSSIPTIRFPLICQAFTLTESSTLDSGPSTLATNRILVDSAVTIDFRGISAMGLYIQNQSTLRNTVVDFRPAHYNGFGMLMSHVIGCFDGGFADNVSIAISNTRINFESFITGSAVFSTFTGFALTNSVISLTSVEANVTSLESPIEDLVPKSILDEFGIIPIKVAALVSFAEVTVERTEVLLDDVTGILEGDTTGIGVAITNSTVSSAEVTMRHSDVKTVSKQGNCATVYLSLGPVVTDSAIIIDRSNVTSECVGFAGSILGLSAFLYRSNVTIQGNSISNVTSTSYAASIHFSTAPFIAQDFGVFVMDSNLTSVGGNYSDTIMFQGGRRDSIQLERINISVARSQLYSGQSIDDEESLGTGFIYSEVSGFSVSYVDSNVTNFGVESSTSLIAFNGPRGTASGVTVVMRNCLVVTSTQNANAVVAFGDGRFEDLTILLGSCNMSVGGAEASMVIAIPKDTTLIRGNITVVDVIADTVPTNLIAGASALFFVQGDNVVNDSSVTVSRTHWTGVATGIGAGGVVGITVTGGSAPVTLVANTSFLIENTVARVSGGGLAMGWGAIGPFILSDTTIDVTASTLSAINSHAGGVVAFASPIFPPGVLGRLDTTRISITDVDVDFTTVFPPLALSVFVASTYASVWFATVNIGDVAVSIADSRFKVKVNSTPTALFVRVADSTVGSTTLNIERTLGTTSTGSGTAAAIEFLRSDAPSVSLVVSDTAATLESGGAGDVVGITFDRVLTGSRMALDNVSLRMARRGDGQTGAVAAIRSSSNSGISVSVTGSTFVSELVGGAGTAHSVHLRRIQHAVTVSHSRIRVLVDASISVTDSEPTYTPSALLFDGASRWPTVLVTHMAEFNVTTSASSGAAAGLRIGGQAPFMMQEVAGVISSADGSSALVSLFQGARPAVSLMDISARLDAGGPDALASIFGPMRSNVNTTVVARNITVYSNAGTKTAAVVITPDPIAPPAFAEPSYIALENISLPEKQSQALGWDDAASSSASHPAVSIDLNMSCVGARRNRLFDRDDAAPIVLAQQVQYAPLSWDEQLEHCNPAVPPSVTRSVSTTMSTETSATGSESISMTASQLGPLPKCGNASTLHLSVDPLLIDGKPARGYDYTLARFGIFSTAETSQSVDAETIRENGINVSLKYTDSPTARWSPVGAVGVSFTCESEDSQPRAQSICEGYLEALPPFKPLNLSQPQLSAKFGTTSTFIVREPHTLSFYFPPHPSLEPLDDTSFTLRFRIPSLTALECTEMSDVMLAGSVEVIGKVPTVVETAAKVTQATTGVAAASALASTSVAADAQALAVFSLISCSSSDSRYAMRQAALLLSPLSLGPEPEGALWGNLVLVLAMFGLQATFIGAIYGFKKFIRKSNEVSLAIVQADARFPSLFVTYAMLFHQGTAVLSLRLLLDGHISFVVVVAALLAVSFPWVVFMYSQRLTVPTFETDISSKLVFFKYVGVGENWPELVGPALRRWLVPVGRWGPPLVRKRFGGPVGAVLPLWVRFAAVPPLQATLVSFVASVKTGSRPGCAAQYAALIALYVVFGLAVVAVRPYRSRFLNVSQVVSYLLLSAILVLQMVRALWPEEYGPQAWMPPPLVCITVLASLRGVYGYWLMVCERCFWRAQGGKVFWCEVRDGTATRDAYEEMVTVETSGRQERVDLRELAAREKLLMTPGQDSVEMKKPSRNRASSGLVDLEELLLDSSQPPHLQGQAAV